MQIASALVARPDLPPAPLPGLEEAAGARVQDWPAAAGFALLRLMERDDPRPVVFVAAPDWTRERGRISARGAAALGLDPARLILVRPRREMEALWALEEALKSGAVAGALGAAAQASFVATKRIDFAARAGDALAFLLRVEGAEELSAARVRWRVASRASAEHPFDARAPGGLRLRAEVVRRRDGPPGAWDLEQDDETHRLRLAAGLADHGLVPDGRTRAA